MRPLTCLILDHQLQILQIGAVDIAGIASQREVGNEAVIVDVDIGGLVARAIVEIAGLWLGQSRRGCGRQGQQRRNSSHRGRRQLPCPRACGLYPGQ
jgi:hypothetical protein